MEMLFRYYGLKDTQEEIAPYVVGGDKNDCRTSLMLQYAWEKGVPMVGIQPAGKPETCMDTLLCLGYDLLVLFYPEFDPNHPEKGASYGHWVLVSYIENGKIYFNDPNKNHGKNRSLFLPYLTRRMAPPMLTSAANVILAAAPRNADKEFMQCRCRECQKEFPVFKEIIPFAQSLLCPFCDRFFPFRQIPLQ